METMREYVVRRAGQVKRYKTVARESGIGESRWEWLKRLARGDIGNPGADSIEILYKHYKLLESKERRNGHRRSA